MARVHVLVPRQWAAELLASHLSAEPGRSNVEAALALLTEEELDSGIVVPRGADIRFWHLSFQDFLAARPLAALPEADQAGMLLHNRTKLLSAECGGRAPLRGHFAEGDVHAPIRPDMQFPCTLRSSSAPSLSTEAVTSNGPALEGSNNWDLLEEPGAAVTAVSPRSSRSASRESESSLSKTAFSDARCKHKNGFRVSPGVRE